MKRFLAAVSFAVFAAPAAAAGLPYEQSLIDRMLPNIQERSASSVETPKAAPAAGMPYEQYVIDRMLPNIEAPAASSGETRKTTPDTSRKSPWADDYHFIAPPL
jgi:hypothetical protein